MAETLEYDLPGASSTVYKGSPTLRRSFARSVPPLALIAETRPIYVVMFGDSLTAEIRRRKGTQKETRRRLGGVEFVGTLGTGAVTGGSVGDPTVYSWEHEGVGGNTSLQIAARVPASAAALAADGIPVDIVDTIFGTNDFFQDLPIDTCEANARTLLTAYRTAWPDCWIIWGAPPQIYAGAGGSYAARNAVRNLFVQNVMPKLAAEFGNIEIVDGFSSMADSEMFSDGTHPLEVGYLRSCRLEAEAIENIVGRAKSNLTLPVRNPYVPLDYNGIQIITAATDAGTIAANALLSPENQSFMASLRFIVDTDVPDASVYSLVSMGTTIADGYLIGLTGIANTTRMGLSFYLADGSPVLAGNLGYGAGAENLGIVTPGVEHEVVVLGDRSHGKACVGLDGQLVAIVDLPATKPASANWNCQVHATKFGRGTLNGVISRMRRFQFYKGANVVNYHHFPRVIEEKWRFGTLPPGLSVHYPMSEGTGSPAEAQAKAGAITFSGGATWGKITPTYL